MTRAAEFILVLVLAGAIAFIYVNALWREDDDG